MTDGETPMQIYHLKDSVSLAHPAHSYEAWHRNTVQFTFTPSSDQARWEISDHNQDPSGTLLRNHQYGDSLTLQVPDKPEVLIRPKRLALHLEWTLEYPDVTLRVKETEHYKLPVYSVRGHRTKHFIVYRPDGSEAAAIRRGSGHEYSVHDAGWSPLTALSLAVGISLQDWHRELNPVGRNPEQRGY